MSNCLTSYFSKKDKQNSSCGNVIKTGFSVPMSLVLSLCMAVIIMTLCTFNTLGAKAVDDDFGIALALSNRFPDMHFCLFINAFLSQIVFTLNTFMPNLNWFWLIERLFTCFALTILLFISFQRLYKQPIIFLLTGVLCLLLIPDCTYKGNFTIVAGFTALVGGVVLIINAVERYPDSYRRILLVCAVILLVFAFMCRAESLLLFLPFFLMTCALLFWRRYKEDKRATLSLPQTFPIIITIGIVVVLSGFNTVVWSSGEWKEWEEYNNARSTISDFPMPKYNKVQSELEAIGVSENDYRMMRSWMTADENIFSENTLSKVATLSESKDLAGMVCSLPHALKKHIKDSSNLMTLVIFIALFILCAVLSKYKIQVLLPLSLGLLIAGLFIAIGRLPPRVECVIWGYAFACSAILIVRKVPCHAGAGRNHSDLAISGNTLQDAKNFRTRYAKVSEIVLWGLSVVCMISLITTVAPSFNTKEIYYAFNQSSYHVSDSCLLTKYVEEHPSDVYLYDVWSFMKIENAYEKEILPSAEFLSHNISCGGWETGSPFWKARLEDLGVDSLFKALYERDNFYFVTIKDHTCSYIETFLREHYHINTQAVLVAEPESGVRIYTFYPSR